MCHDVSVVYVSYKSDIDLLKQSVKSIIDQVKKIYIVDNTPNGDERLNIFLNYKDKLEIVYLRDNLGIAFAQNVGIKLSIEHDNVNYIMLSDQDTLYPQSYIKDMLLVFNNNDNVAAVAPKFKDEMKTSSDGFIVPHPVFFKQVHPDNGKIELMQAIASGKILNANFLTNIGLMKEELFIDWVDLEWCWRARFNGYKIIGNADVTIHHRLGDCSVNIGYKEVNLRSYIRHYYITRNAFYLSLYSKELDKIHKVILFLKAFRYVVGYPILSKPRLKNLKGVLLGFYHGIIGRLGKLND